jgi:hypothetical protein
MILSGKDANIDELMVQLEVENLGKDRHGGMRPNFDDQIADQGSEPTLQKGEILEVTQRMALKCYLGD